jgi:hypothetical protein
LLCLLAQRSAVEAAAAQEQVPEQKPAQLPVPGQEPMPTTAPAPAELGSFARRAERSDLRFDLCSIPVFCCSRM